MAKLCAILVSVSMLLVACGSSEPVRREMVAANASAIQKAREIQSLLKQTKKCPADLDGWNRPDGLSRLEKEFLTPDMHYWMYFTCDENLSFNFTVKYDMDDGTFVSGRDTGPLEITYGHFTDSRTLEILPSDDPAAVAMRVVDERW